MLHYSVHTYELYTRLTYHEYYMVYQSLKELEPSIEPKSLSHTTMELKEDSLIFRKLPAYGINYIELSSIKCEDAMLQCFLYVVVNPYNALKKCSQSDEKIIMPYHINAAYEKINSSLTDILPSMIVNCLTLRRVDFCVNLPFSSQSQAEEYIHLLRLGVPPKVLTEKKIYDEIQRREIPYKDSLLLECGSYSFEVYSKYIQMKNRKLQNPECASGIVRIELRAGKQKLQQLARKYDFPLSEQDYSFFLIHAPYIAKQEITKILSSMVGSKDFHHYSYTKDKIEHSDFRETNITHMLGTIAYFSRRKYYGDFIKKFNLKQEDWKKMIQKFNEIGCSPITLPDNYPEETFPGIESWDSFFG